MADLKVPFARAEAADALSEGLPGWVREDRMGALQAFAATPVETSSLFIRHVVTEGAPVDRVGLGDAGAPAAEPPARATVPAGFAAAATLADGVVTAIGTTEAAAAAGVRFSSIRQALATDPEWARARLTDPRVQSADKFFQLTRALYGDGLLLDVPDGVRLDGAVKVDVLDPTPGRAAFWRLSAHVGARAHAEVEESQGLGGAARPAGPAVAGVSTESVVGEGAELNYTAVGNLSRECGVFINRQAHAAARAKVRFSLANFGGALTKSLVHTQLSGDASEVKHAEVAFGTGTQRFDLSSFATHEGRRAKSDVLARAALRNRSKGNVKGMIKIEHRGADADSYLGQFALLLDPGAKAVAIPGLEIETSQVLRAKHAASVSQIDESQVFYLGSRGVDADGARRLIVEGFLSPAVAGSRSGAFRETVRALVESRWGEA